MANLTRRFKLEYTDSNGDTQVIAEYGQDTGALKMQKWVHIRRVNDPDILKVWLEGTDFGNSIPTRKGEFGNAGNNENEPEILYKQYNPDTSSFDTRGRFFAKNTGTINENGQLAVKLYSLFRFHARSSVNTGTINTDTEAALNAVLPSGYTADVPGSVTAPSVDAYSLNARREKGFQELTRNYKYALTFTANLDGNNDYLVKYEPEGFGGTVDTIISNQQASSYIITSVDTGNNIFTVPGDRTDELVVDQAILVTKSTGNDGTYTISNLSYDSNNNETDITVSENVSDSTADGIIIPGGQAVFKSWEKDKTDSIVNKVTVEGTNSSNNTVSATATNQTQIDNFGEKFRKYKIGYVESSSEAQTIAEKYLVPGLDDQGNDIATVPESGTVKTTVYTDNVVNDSFQVVDNTRNIDDTYTVVQQRNYWPEGSSELEFEFEQENLEESARDSENLRDERARLYPSTTTDVGKQNVDADTEDVTDSYDGHNSQQHPHDVGGKTSTRDGGSSRLDYGDSFESSDNSIAAFSSFTEVDSFVPTSSFSNGMTITITGNNDGLTNGTESASEVMWVKVENDSTGIDYPAPSGVPVPLHEAGNNSEKVQMGPVTIYVPENVVNQTYNILCAMGDNSEAGWDIIYTWSVFDEHSHDVQFESDRAQDRSDGSTNSTNPSDSSAGDTTSLNADGSTDTKNVDVATEDNRDR